MSIFGAIGSAIMTPLYYLVSGVLLAWHKLFTLIGLGYDSGWTWALAIVGLTITIRVLLIPLFVKQIKSARNMQLLQPQIRELQKKYSHDRERLTQEQMKLWKDTGTNPFASCLPLLVQMPIFFALFRCIDQAVKKAEPKGFLTTEHVHSLKSAFIGAIDGAHVGIGDTFNASDHLTPKIVTMALVVAMCATQFITQRQLMAKNMPESALSGPYAQQQKILLYTLPFVFAISGVIFPLGVLIYWTTSNLWTMGQQFYVIRNNPSPGTPAFKAKQERDRLKGREVAEDPHAKAKKVDDEKAPPPPQRQQPKRRSRSKRTNQGKKGGN
jgi:YidC/Oxa1 family membrane protein insertase